MRAGGRRSDSSEDDDDDDAAARKKKHVPDWAQPLAVATTLISQDHINPDDIFGQCPDTIDLIGAWQGMPPPPKLDAKGRPRRDYTRRGSSGDWSKDTLSLQELQHYRAQMGF